MNTNHSAQQQASANNQSGPGPGTGSSAGGIPPGGNRGSGGRVAGFILIAVGLIIGINWLFPSAYNNLFQTLGSSAIGLIIIILGIFFITRECIPNRTKPYRLGRITTGIVFLWAGIGLAAAPIIPASWFTIALKLWPIILIGYGLEYLVRRHKGLKTKLDISGLFLILLVYLITTGVQIDRSFSYLVSGHGYTIQDEPIVITPSRLGSFQLEASVGTYTIVPATDGKVTITPTYRSWKEQSLSKLKQKSQIDIDEENGDVTVQLHTKKDYHGIHIVGLYEYSVDMQIAVPAEMLLNVTTDVGKITVNGNNNVHKLQTDIGIIELTNSKGEDTQLQISIGKIDVEQYRGKLSAVTDIGMIEVDGEPTDDWSLYNGIGYLEAELPSSGSYRFDMNVDIGNTEYPTSKSSNTSDHSQQIYMKVDIGSAVAKYME
ncbi:MAG: hypothetical protein K0R67_500 [Paenibacillus sp.]|nr:hypothetical protein [Paenibacillus sp.]